MIMYYHENNNDYKLILMWFIDVSDNVHGLTDGETDGHQKDSSCVCDDPGKSFLYLKIIKIGWHMRLIVVFLGMTFLYDFVMLHVCYIYCDILNYHVIMSHNIYIYIHISIINFQCIQFEMILHDSSTYQTFNNIIHNWYWCKLQNVEISMIMYYHEN